MIWGSLLFARVELPTETVQPQILECGGCPTASRPTGCRKRYGPVHKRSCCASLLLIASTFDSPTQLSFSHWRALSGQADTLANYHPATFDLVPEGAATKVTLSQADLTGGVTASNIEHRADYEKNWASVLDGVAMVSMHEELT